MDHPPAQDPSRDDAAAAGGERGDRVTRGRNGALVVRGRLTRERARLITGGMASPLVPIGFGLLVVAGVFSLLRGDRALAALDAVLALWLGWITLPAPARRAQRLMQLVGPGEVSWTYTPEGIAITHAGGETVVPWKRVRDARLRGDMLVVRAQGERFATGGLVGPLSPEQLELVRGWARAARGTSRPATRRAG